MGARDDGVRRLQRPARPTTASTAFTRVFTVASSSLRSANDSATAIHVSRRRRPRSAHARGSPTTASPASRAVAAAARTPGASPLQSARQTACRKNAHAARRASLCRCRCHRRDGAVERRKIARRLHVRGHVAIQVALRQRPPHAAEARRRHRCSPPTPSSQSSCSRRHGVPLRVAKVPSPYSTRARAAASSTVRCRRCARARPRSRAARARSPSEISTAGCAPASHGAFTSAHTFMRNCASAPLTRKLYTIGSNSCGRRRSRERS